MNVLVIYNSRNGNTQDAAEAIAQAADNQFHTTVSTKSVIEVQQADVEQADVIFVGTWVHGWILFGVRPAGAELWVPALPSLEGKPVGVFCTYAFNPRDSLRKLGAMLEERGATLLGQRAFHRNRPDEGAEHFAQSILESAKRELA
jgi:flavodoxin